jgi:pyridoxal biosynthesis lyase PdxS
MRTGSITQSVPTVKKAEDIIEIAERLYTETASVKRERSMIIYKSIEVVRYLSAHTPKEMLIIGAGGVMTPAEATSMLNAGAHLVQIYSAFIYEGPFVVKRIAEACK